MNNEPVAWMVTSKVICLEPIEGAIPLYKHQAKSLTDEEIIAIADDPWLCNKDGSLRSCIDFARAILRKASEK